MELIYTRNIRNLMRMYCFGINLIFTSVIVFAGMVCRYAYGGRWSLTSPSFSWRVVVCVGVTCLWSVMALGCTHLTAGVLPAPVGATSFSLRQASTLPNGRRLPQ